MKVSDRKIDLVKREQGAWVDNIPEWDGLKVKVRGMGNKDWVKLEQKLINAVARAKRVNGLDPEDRARINGILLRDCALIDWQGIDGDDGKPQPYSKAAADKYLTAPENEPFRDAILWAAMVVAEQGKAEVEADAGKLIEVLRWQLQWGPTIATWEHLLQQGREAPAGFYEMPDLQPHVQELLTAFDELGTERQLGMAIGPIPRSRMRAYLIEELDLDGEELHHAMAVLRRVDGEYLSMINKQGKRDDDNVRELVKATDREGMKKMVRRLGKKK